MKNWKNRKNYINWSLLFVCHLLSAPPYNTEKNPAALGKIMHCSNALSILPESFAFSPKVVYAEEEHGRSIVAARDVKPGEVGTFDIKKWTSSKLKLGDTKFSPQVLIKATPLVVGPRMHNPTPSPLPCLGCYKVDSWDFHHSHFSEIWILNLPLPIFFN